MVEHRLDNLRCDRIEHVEEPLAIKLPAFGKTVWKIDVDPLVLLILGPNVFDFEFIIQRDLNFLDICHFEQ